MWCSLHLHWLEVFVGFYSRRFCFKKPCHVCLTVFELALFPSDGRASSDRSLDSRSCWENPLTACHCLWHSHSRATSLGEANRPPCGSHPLLAPRLKLSPALLGSALLLLPRGYLSPSREVDCPSSRHNRHRGPETPPLSAVAASRHSRRCRKPPNHPGHSLWR